MRIWTANWTKTIAMMSTALLCAGVTARGAIWDGNSDLDGGDGEEVEEDLTVLPLARVLDVLDDALGRVLVIVRVLGGGGCHRSGPYGIR